MLKKLLCSWLGHEIGDPVIDCERRKSFNPCLRCGAECQYDFQKKIPLDWIGYQSGENQCPVCFGWKSKSWSMCGQRLCVLNPGYPIYRN